MPEFKILDGVTESSDGARRTVNPTASWLVLEEWELHRIDESGEERRSSVPSTTGLITETSEIYFKVFV